VSALPLENVPERFARQLLIEGWQQERLSAARVVLIGVGALGNEVARQLAMAGVGTLVLCDPDVVAESNLSRCCLFRPADVGIGKVAAAARELALLAPGVRVEQRPAPLDSGVGLAELRDADLVIGCLDSTTARVLLSSRCHLVGATLLDGGTSEWGGEVHCFMPGGACYGCLIGASGRARADDPVSCSGPVQLAPVGATAPVSGLIGSWLSIFALRRLFALPVPAQGLHVDAASALTSHVRADRAPDCPLHETLPLQQVESVAPSVRSRVRDVLDLLAADEDVMIWRGFANSSATGAAENGAYARGQTLLRHA
jgi:molybdopterin/thiamine biosynthesis adenylyltransferase